MALSSISLAVVDVHQWQRDNAVKINTDQPVGAIKIVDTPSFTNADKLIVAPHTYEDFAAEQAAASIHMAASTEVPPHSLTWPEAFEYVGIGVCIVVGVIFGVRALGKAFVG